jgi:hypothetical protein
MAAGWWTVALTAGAGTLRSLGDRTMGSGAGGGRLTRCWEGCEPGGPGPGGLAACD